MLSPLDHDDRDREFTLIIRFRGRGFFSNFNAVLNNLSRWLQDGPATAAVIDWCSGPGCWSDSYGRTPRENLWPRLFEPLAFNSFPGSTVNVDRFASVEMTNRYAYAMYKLDRGWRRKYNEIYVRYIRVRPSIQERVDAVWRMKMVGAFCAGVHYRHPEHDRECLHPIGPPEAFIARLRRLLPADRPRVVFLATDVEPVVEVFRAAFSDRLIVQPGVRRAATWEAKALHSSGDTDAALAEEVLIDGLLLARCDVMLHVTSNVATAVGYINPDLRIVYCESAWQAFEGYVWSLALLLVQRFPRARKSVKKWRQPLAPRT